MRVLRWVKQSLCSLSVLNVGWEDGEGEGAELLEGICWCYANRVSVWLWRCAMLPAEVNKQTNKQNVNGKPAGLFLPEGPAPFARTPLLSKRP